MARMSLLQDYIQHSSKGAFFIKELEVTYKGLVADYENELEPREVSFVRSHKILWKSG